MFPPGRRLCRIYRNWGGTAGSCARDRTGSTRTCSRAAAPGRLGDAFEHRRLNSLALAWPLPCKHRMLSMSRYRVAPSCEWDDGRASTKSAASLLKSAGARHMPIDYAAAIQPSEITPKAVWLRRRELLAGAAASGLAGSCREPAEAAPLTGGQEPAISTDEPPTPLDGHHQLQQFLRVRHRQGRPGRQRAQARRPAPGRSRSTAWSPSPPSTSSRTSSSPSTLEERIYRHALRRGLVDGDPLDRLPAGRSAQAGRAQGSAKYVAFETLVRPEEMPGQQRLLPGRWTGPMSRGCGWTRRCTR